MHIPDEARDAVASLDEVQVRRLFKVLIAEDDATASQILKRTPRGTERPISDALRDALLDALEARISPDNDDPDAVETTILPRYADFAEDLRDD